MVRVAEALPIAEISRRDTVFYLNDVIGIEAMIRRGLLAALARGQQHCLATPAGAIKNCAAPRLVFGCLIPISIDFALRAGKGTRQNLDERRQPSWAAVFAHLEPNKPS